MFSDYELTEFSTRMLVIRKNLGFSREVVSVLTGINVDTIRKIEKGINIPRFETLEILSNLYKTDLLQLLNNYKNNTSITYFYESLNTCLINNNITSFFILHSEFMEWLKSQNKSKLVNQSELIQLEKFFHALFHRFSDQNISLELIIDELSSALKVSIPSFSLKNWKFSNYNILELRILYCIASFLLQSKNYILSNNILVYLLQKVDVVSHSKLNADMLSVKLYSLIAYNHHMLDEHTEALKIAEKGITLCQKVNIMESLPLLLSRKGVAMYNLKMPNYQLYLNQAVVLLEIQGNINLANQYKEINKKFSISKDYHQ